MKKQTANLVFPPRKCGFALIMALGLMSLIVLLLLTLVSLVQIESQVAKNSLDAALARQNALVGAYQAIGELQRTAGPDARVTARADIDSANSVNPYWTGVWNSASTSSPTPLRWLVSTLTNSSLSPAVPIAAPDRVVLCKGLSVSGGIATGSLTNPVTALRIPINSADQQNGGYAWWIADEGVKASVAFYNDAAIDEADEDIINGTSKAERKKARALTAPRTALEVVSNDPANYLLPETEKELIDRLSSAQQLAYVDRNSFPENGTVSQLTHDYTMMSRGVLAHTLPNISPSLKIDLSTQLSIDDGTDYWAYNGSTKIWEPSKNASYWNGRLPAQWRDWGAPLSAFLNVWRAENSNAFLSHAAPKTNSLSRLPLVAPIPAAAATGKPMFSILPTLSEFSIHYVPYFRGETFHTGNFSPTSTLAATLIAEGNLTIAAQTINVGGATHNYYIANRSAIERIAQDPSIANKSMIPGNILYRVTGFFELWNPYTAEIAFPRESASPTGTISGYLRAEITGLPTHKLTYWRDRNCTNFDMGSMRLEKDDSWSVANADMTGESKPINMQTVLGRNGGSTPLCVNLPIPAKISISGGSLQPWLGFANLGISGGRVFSSGWGLKEGLTTFRSAAGVIRERGSVYNLFAGYPFITGALSISPALGLAPVVASDDGGNGITSVQQMTVMNMYVQVEDATTPPEYQIALRWITSTNANANTGVALGAYRMPAPDRPLNFGRDIATSRKAAWLPGFDGEIVDNARLETLVSRFGYFFARKDAVLTDSTNTANSWWLSALPDPRSINQNTSGQNNQFVLMRDPEEVYAYFSEATDILKTRTMLERPNGATRARKNNARDEMIDTEKNDTKNAAVSEDLVNYQKDPDRYFDKIFPDYDRQPLEDLSTKIPLFEIPTTRPVSLGVLQHMAFEGMRPFCVGNSWGNTVAVSGTLTANAVFDIYTLTGLDSATLTGITNLTKALPHPDLEPLWTNTHSVPTVTSSGTYSSVAANFLSRGAFNINSTSVLAWKTMLAGTWLDGAEENQWEFLNIDAQTAQTDNTKQPQGLRRSFYRFPHTADETFVAPSPTQARNEHKLLHHNRPIDEMQDTMSYRRGVRIIPDEKIEAMAVSIVESIRQRKKPFGSMQEFLAPDGAESVIEKAIRIADINGAADWDPDIKAENKPHPYAASYLTQADILSTLAPRLQARSDTFKIRAYGDVRESSGEIVASAICEIIVQRMPETAKENDDIANPDDLLGRKFKIISTRWINE